MLKLGIPSHGALCAFDRRVDAVICGRGGGTVPDEFASENWAPLLEVARLLRADGKRLRTRDPGSDLESMARIWEDVRRRTDQQKQASASWFGQHGQVWQRYCQSLVAGLCLGMLTIGANRLGGVPLYLAVSPSLGLTLTSIAYGLSGRAVEIRPISPIGMRRR